MKEYYQFFFFALKMFFFHWSNFEFQISIKKEMVNGGNAVMQYL